MSEERMSIWILGEAGLANTIFLHFLKPEDKKDSLPNLTVITFPLKIAEMICIAKRLTQDRGNSWRFGKQKPKKAGQVSGFGSDKTD